METLFQIDAHNRTAEQAANEFAATYWQEPRKRTRIQPDGSFHLRDGVATYYVRLNSTAMPPVFVIEKPESA